MTLTQISSAYAKTSTRLIVAPRLGLIMWTCLWCNLNSGFWNLQAPNTSEDWQYFIRAALPFVVLPLSLLRLMSARRLPVRASSPSRFLLLYGLVAAFAFVFSPQPTWSLYWSTTFVSTILVAWTCLDSRDPLASSRQLLVVTWIATFIVAAIIAYQARNSVFGTVDSGYGAVMGDLKGASRSSGVARWAAVPGLVCLIRAYHTKWGPLFAFYLGITAVSIFIVYRMQSRGAVFGSFAAIVFALLISSKMRRYALPFVVLAIATIVIVETPEVLSEKVVTYLERGQSQEQFVSMTGRTRAYEHGLTAFQDAPIFGRGQWADRLVIGEHVHNSFLQALLNGGILGLLPYLASWIAGWLLFFKIQKKNRRLTREDRVHLLEAGTVMMFFTVRAIPETTTASFAVDLLVMVAVFVYLESLAKSLIRRKAIAYGYTMPGMPPLRHQTSFARLR